MKFGTKIGITHQKNTDVFGVQLFLENQLSLHNHAIWSDYETHTHFSSFIHGLAHTMLLIPSKF
jgi:hypothetical protein